ncbi:hypothetical protein JKP88DRAFT_173881 [Tribonema minus]|uniref:Diaminopimelate decarboxylase n=1 Tax=Tribonema minus TaxID=303371 RepID=A0A836CQQ3_9STRA|nr:hypothetical protein JKP88DRAFT_173881 [Tribonema minus]
MVAAEPEVETKLEQLRFLTPETAEAVRSTYGTPAYVYDVASLKANARECLSFPNAFGLTVRFAMKSCPNAAVLQLFNSMGLHIDASSGWEVRRAMAAGVPADHISLSTQELPRDFAELLGAGVRVNACSLSQASAAALALPGHHVGLRVNPGLGSGGTKRTNVGGPGSSFGIWHEQLGEAEAIIAKHGLHVARIHTHIGSGSDPAVWQRVSGLSLDLMRRFPTATHLNLGGGYKVGRMSYEYSTDLKVIGEPVKGDFEAFAAETGRRLHLEIEPGTFLVANVGAIVSTIQDIVSTSGDEGHTFIKLDAGMTDLLRPSLYGAQHPLVTLPAGGAKRGPPRPYVVVGHCCESGDILTPAPGEPDVIAERVLGEARIGDVCVVEGCGAYVSGMSAKNYNSFPEAPEVLLGEDGQLHLVRRRQALEQIYQNELPLPESIMS